MTSLDELRKALDAPDGFDRFAHCRRIERLKATHPHSVEHRELISGSTCLTYALTYNKALAAKVERARYEKELAKMELGERPSITLKEALDTFLQSQEKSGEYRNIKTYVAKMLGTNKSGEETIDIYGLDGQLAFHELTTAQVQRLILARRNEGNADATILLELVQPSKAIKLIDRLGYLVPNVELKGLKAENDRKPAKQKLRYSSHDEEARLMIELDPATAMNDTLKAERADMRDFVICLLGTGGRYSEVAELKWTDVNLTAKSVSLWRGKVRNESMLPMTDAVFTCLTQRLPTKRDDQVYVFENEEKTGPRNYAPKAFVNACERAGLEGVTLHTLRKTFASRLVQGGVPLYDVSKLIGHGNVTTTSKHYAFLAPNSSHDRALEVLNGSKPA